MNNQQLPVGHVNGNKGLSIKDKLSQMAALTDKIGQSAKDVLKTLDELKKKP